ncbi:uncharacterized protein LOC108594533 isoform X3 [Drosophila busckii]|uniref:uncharacterized protein LOC108594533 isoform X3 n=1 Tax=Drosophila busckii TaxID=30019 RepID=UPI00083EAC2D|nr:uncharacterized protein LOC108594533 isoform X3 [Drosophila busckii]
MTAMKSDILTLCILAATILGSTRHAIGFLTAEAASAPLDSAGFDGEQQQQQQQSRHFNGLLNLDAALQSRRQLHAPERNVYDPGDELLQALDAELGQELQLEPDYAPIAEQQQQQQVASNKYDMLKRMEEDLRDEQELVDKSALLMKMLEDPTLDTLPLVYVEEQELPAQLAPDTTVDYPELNNEQGLQALMLGEGKAKRSRYYRRFPWKRHTRTRGSAYMNSINSNYEPELRYACTPSKEDIYKLLVNLHENRKGNHSKTVNFCNRKRPAKAVFTNIRFLG